MCTKARSLAIIGPNGAGKTTFLNICTGYLRPQSGTVRLESRDITRRAPRAIARMGVARAFQIPQLFLEHTTLENLLIAASVRERRWSIWRALDDVDEREEMLELLQLVGLGAVTHAAVNELPEGQRKLADIAVALALSPRLLLMDEPTSGVSSQEKFEVMGTLTNALRARNVTSVFVEHDMEVVRRYADRVAVWSEGKIQIVGTPDVVLNDPQVLSNVVGL